MEENNEYKLTLEEINYEIAQTKSCIKDGEYLLNLRNGYLSELEKARIKKSIDINNSILNKLKKQKEILKDEKNIY